MAKTRLKIFRLHFDHPNAQYTDFVVVAKSETVARELAAAKDGNCLKAWLGQNVPQNNASCKEIGYLITDDLEAGIIVAKTRKTPPNCPHCGASD